MACINVIIGILSMLAASVVAAANTPAPARLVSVAGGERDLTVVYVHGVYHGSWSFAELHPLIAPYVGRQYLLDLQGHYGDNRVKPRDDIGYEDYLNDLDTALDSVKGKKVLVGHSLGGLLSMSSMRRDDVAGVVLLATPLPEVIRRKRWSLLLRYPIKSLAMVLKRDAKSFYHNKDWARRYFFSESTPGYVIDEAFEMIREQNEPFKLFDDINALTIDVGHVKKPVLVLAGAADPTVDREAAEKLAARLQVEPVVIAGAGHDLMLEPRYAEVVADYVSDWLAHKL